MSTSVPAALTRVTRVRFTAVETAAYAACHPDTVTRAAAAGRLHGSQRTKPNGRWSFHIDCVDAWLDGRPCPHNIGGDA